eukprot:CAMPEP_0114327350 /NCGR_PEP_ID=MMETSP0059-20121206/30250_1 /TAXON_ID=36894 /ORGANISM="Pyramimonas parkeae, Strain CCMP726" /LENGTH=64 /DNA_ID=CAMNT_0001456463 /DNA_START=321 /DNA_END=512 /DNA_ORIENTATION=+
MPLFAVIAQHRGANPQSSSSESAEASLPVMMASEKPSSLHASTPVAPSTRQVVSHEGAPSCAKH